jgi:hypothetical protein
MVEARSASAGRAMVFSILRTPRVRRNSPNHQCAESFFAGRRYPCVQAPAGHAPATGDFSTWRRFSDDKRRYGGVSDLAADQSVTDRLFLSGAADHEIWFPQLAIWTISPPRRSGQNAHQPAGCRWL